MRTHRNWLLSLILLFQINLLLAQSPSDELSDRRIYLSGKDAETKVYWDFKISDGRKTGNWSKIPVPSNWEMQGFGSFHPPSKEMENLSNDEKETGIYRHYFFAELDWRKSDVNLIFEGVLSGFEVNLNGETLVPDYAKTFGKTIFNVSENIDFGDRNLLEVNVYKYSDKKEFKDFINSDSHWVFGGIYRPVFLEISPKYHFTISKLQTLADGSFHAQLDFSDLPKSASLRLELKETDSGEIRGSFSQEVSGKSISIDHNFGRVNVWNPESPKLYEILLSFNQKNKTLYQKSVKVGFRTVKFEGNNTLLVNQVPVTLKGFRRTPFYPTTGRSLSGKNMLEEINLIKAMNGNVVWMPHIGPEDYFLDLADSLGLFVLADGDASFHPALIPFSTGLVAVTENLAAEAVIRDDLGGKLDFDKSKATKAALGPYRRKNAKFYSNKASWSPVRILDFDPINDFSGKVLLRNDFDFSDLGAFRIRWSVEKINAWDECKILYSGGLDLPKVLPGDSVEIDLGLPADWWDGDLLKITAVDTGGNELNTWSKSIRSPQAGNGVYFKNRAVLQQQAVLVRESSTDLQLAVGNRLFVFGKALGDLQLVKVNREPIYLSQVRADKDSRPNQRKVTWRQSDDGSVEIFSVNDLSSEYFSWTVFPSGEALLKTGFGTGNISYSKAGFNYKVADIKGIKWIGNGPFPKAELGRAISGFGLWVQTNSLEITTPASSYRPDNTSGFYTDIHALQLTGDRGQVEIRMESTDVVLSINRSQTGGNEFPNGSNLRENIEIGIEPIPGTEKPDSKPTVDSPNGNSKTGEIVLWLRFD